MSDMTPYYEREGICIYVGDNREVLPTLGPESISAVVTDPPYDLTQRAKTTYKSAFPGRYKDHKPGGGFMGMEWDATGIAFDPVFWEAVEAAMLPGAHLLAFGGSRTYHRIAVAIEDAGFEIRDTLQWMYGTGFPKSLDVSKAIDKAQKAQGTYGGPKTAAHAGWIERGRMRADDGHEGYQRPWMQDSEAVDKNAREYLPATDAARDWQGWGTALKPAYEPIVLARKPPSGTVAANVLAHGTGALNIDGCRVGTTRDVPASLSRNKNPNGDYGPRKVGTERDLDPNIGRWPPNVLMDETAAALLDAQSGERGKSAGVWRASKNRGIYSAGVQGVPDGKDGVTIGYGDTGGASRFFPVLPIDDPDTLRFSYVAKASRRERGEGNSHPTVKPLALMRWLLTLVTPPGGMVLDPFCGSGSTLVAAAELGIAATGIELSEEYAEIAARRIDSVLSRDRQSVLPLEMPS